MESGKDQNRIVIISVAVVLALCIGILACAFCSYSIYWIYKSSIPAPLGGGGYIAYTAIIDEKTTQIRKYNVATKQDTLVLNDQTYKFWFSWSPDNKQILFQSDFHPPISRLVMIDADGKNIQDIVDDPDFRSWMPSIAPDGKKFVFCSDRDGTFKIYVMNLDGTGLVKLTDFDSSTPQWSPDGKQIVFQSEVSGNFEIYKMDADGSHQVKLTNDPANDMGPSWSPDGKYISFSSTQTGEDKKSDVFIMNPDGTGIVNMTNNPSTDSGGSWSPDSRYLAFESNRSGEYQLYFIEIDNPVAVRIPILSEKASAPSWSH